MGEAKPKTGNGKDVAEVTKKPPSVTVINSAAGTIPRARLRRRHVWLAMSFAVFVALPTFSSLYYMYQVASDQYLSRVSFSIRSQELQSPVDALAGLGQLATGSSSDPSILNEYLRSQKVVEDIAASVDLVALYSKPEFDPVFALKPDQNFEALVAYFHRMTHVSFDPNNGILDVEVFAFSAEEAQMIASELLQVSSVLVQELSTIAQTDTTRLAKLELELAREKLAEARVALGEFRGREQIVDPLADLEGQMGVLTALQNQLAGALVELDVLLTTTAETDRRVASARDRVAAIERRIDEERKKVGQSETGGDGSLATVVGNYETLIAEREFAESSYLSAAVTYEAALAEARRKSKYVAAHIPPTLAQSSQYPTRLLWVLCIFGASLLVWSVVMLSIYAMLDRR